MAANASNSINVTNSSVNQVMALLKDPAFCSTLNFELKSENVTPTGVWYRFHHGVTFTSWGEKITITLSETAPSNVRIDVHSECGMPTQIIDWGKNKQNISAIFEYISRNLSRYVAVAPAAAPSAPQTASAPAAPATPQAATAPVAPSQERRFCFNCGARLNRGALFCSNCGAKQS